MTAREMKEVTGLPLSRGWKPDEGVREVETKVPRHRAPRRAACGPRFHVVMPWTPGQRAEAVVPLPLPRNHSRLPQSHRAPALGQALREEGQLGSAGHSEDSPAHATPGMSCAW